MSPLARTLLWVLAAIAPLAIAVVVIVRWDHVQEVRAAEAEAARTADSVARIVSLTAGVAQRQLESLADSAALEAALIVGAPDALAAELQTFRHSPSWRAMVLIEQDGEAIASAGNLLASDLEAAPEGGGITIVPRLGLEPARAVLSVPVVVGTVERAWLVGTYSIAPIEAALADAPTGGLNLLSLPDGTVLLGPSSAIDQPIAFTTDGIRTRARIAGKTMPAAIVPVLDGSARVASIQEPSAFGRGVTGAVATLLLAMGLLATVISAWRYRLVQTENRLRIRERELGALQDLATDSTISSSYEQILQMAGARAAELMPGIDATFVALTQGEREEVLLHCTYPEPKPPTEVPIAGNLLLARVLQHGQREAGSPARVDPTWREAGFAGAKWESWTPLVAHGRILGAVACVSLLERGALESDEARLLDGLAATLAVALESYERLSELDRQRAVLATVVDASPDGLLAMDAENRIFLDNPASRELLRPDRPLPGRTLADAIEGTRRAGGVFEFDFDPERLLQKSRAGNTTRGSFRLRFDGETQIMESLMAPLALPQGGAGSLVSMRDVSERAELEEVRRLHHELTRLAQEMAGRAALLEQVLAASDMGLVFLDAAGEVAYANQAFGDFLGIPLPQAGLDEAGLLAIARGNVEGELNDLRAPAVLHTRGPARRILALRSVEVRDNHGREVGRLVSLRDETAQRELEEARESFIGVAAHELKNPLAVLRLQAEAGLRDERRAKEALERILVRTRQLQDLVDRLLDVTRADLRRLSLDCANVNVVACVREAAEPFLAQGQVIGVDGDPSLVVRADALRIKQVVTNLLSNAVRYAGGGRLDATIRASDGEVRIAVRDEGPGIPEEEQAHIFDRFAQGRSASRGPGLGIGLYLSRRIAEAHGGRMELESRPGAGSTFTLVLPRVPGDVDYGPASTQAAAYP